MFTHVVNAHKYVIFRVACAKLPDCVRNTEDSNATEISAVLFTSVGSLSDFVSRSPLVVHKLLHQQGTSGDCLDLNIPLLEKRCQQACGSPAGITFLFEHTLTQRSKSALAWPSTSPWTYNIPVAVCSCFTDLSNPVTALTFVPAERSKNCKSDRDCTFLRYPKILYFNFGCHYDCIASILKIRRVWVCSMQTMPNYTRLHAFA